jgi:hypothetical protein
MREIGSQGQGAYPVIERLGPLPDFRGSPRTLWHVTGDAFDEVLVAAACRPIAPTSCVTMSLRNAGAEDIERRGILPPIGRGLDARGGLRPGRHGGIGENQYRDDAGCPLQHSERDPLSLTAVPHFP